MRLSRPVAIGLLGLLAALVLWLVLGTGVTDGEAGDDRAAAPSSSTMPDASDEAGPTGVDTRSWDDVSACADTVLPPELEPVVDDIEDGGPYDYPGKDGSTFRNDEGYLPQESGGYYREFTVETPGLSHRGAKRVVAGGDEIDPEVWYYTDDHYESFCEFAPAG
ncbi:ribonuclease domain-containing protein [uncultured Serinicoccus sp.]|uniref:ribonuclease domain-containing protein n=1 Tax=uncultured Serinicoccus sp. TaxID=735514 RepID=UPI002617F4DD|nr:ribonuclease domain-containing protein [uncultured Serinicoccus sp.]